MSKKLIVLIALVTLILVFTLSGCGSKEGSQTDQGKSTSQSTEQKSTGSQSTEQKSAGSQTTEKKSAGSGDSYAIASGGTGGNYYKDASGIADVLSKKLGITMTSQVTGAAVENARLTSKGKNLLGMVTADVAYQAYRGEGSWAKEKLDNLRAILPGFEASNHILVKADSSIKTVQDLKGKRVSLGAPGSGTYSQNLILLDAMGLSVNDVKPQTLSFTESAEALKDGNLDAALMLSVYPLPAVMDFVNTVNGRLIPIAEEVRKKIKEKYPFENMVEIPGGVYKGIDNPTSTYGYVNWLVTTKDAPEDLIYNITKTIIESNADLKAIAPSTSDWGTRHLKNSDYPMPLHPGAERYFKEKGISFKVIQ